MAALRTEPGSGSTALSAIALTWSARVHRYILVYPQGCDVCNHLSLFLCVADYEKLLPGWNHFAQFTIAVVNSDPKKSKYSGAHPPPPSAAAHACR